MSKRASATANCSPRTNPLVPSMGSSTCKDAHVHRFLTNHRPVYQNAKRGLPRFFPRRSSLPRCPFGPSPKSHTLVRVKIPFPVTSEAPPRPRIQSPLPPTRAAQTATEHEIDSQYFSQPQNLLVCFYYRLFGNEPILGKSAVKSVKNEALYSKISYGDRISHRGRI